MVTLLYSVFTQLTQVLVNLFIVSVSLGKKDIGVGKYVGFSKPKEIKYGNDLSNKIFQ